MSYGLTYSSRYKPVKQIYRQVEPEWFNNTLKSIETLWNPVDLLKSEIMWVYTMSFLISLSCLLILTRTYTDVLVLAVLFKDWFG